MAYGLEPSEYAFDQYRMRLTDNMKQNNKSHHKNCHLYLECMDLIQYFKRHKMSDEDILKMNKNKRFCYCSRYKNGQYYKVKEEKIMKERKKQKYKDKIKDIDDIYNEFPCLCYNKFDGLYNLGICVSVLQYVKDDDVDIILNKLSKECDFLYFDVVTKEEYDIMKNGSTFDDKWAIKSRSRNWYLKIILKYWRIISNEILESKYFYPDDNNKSLFTSPNIPNTLYIRNEFNEQ